MATPSGEGRGWATPCYRRWERAGRPDTGPPAPAGHTVTNGKSTKAEVARRMQRFAELRAEGLTVAGIAQEMGIALRAAEHYAAKYRQQVRDELAAAQIDWPVPASPVQGVTHWSGKAACRGHWDLFFAPDGPEPQEAKEVREAKAKSLCAACPVRAQCRAEAKSGPGRFGTWAGLSEDDRERARKQRKNASRRVAARREQGTEVAA
jgi:WhiB family redox-sensing transcriptional regulator